MSDKQPLPIKALISTTAVLASLYQKSSQLLALDQILQTLLPPPLRGHCRVANYRQGILVIETVTAGWHMRLRHEHAGLLSALRQQQLPELITIMIKVNPDMRPIKDIAGIASVRTPIVPLPISSRNARRLHLLALRCPPGLRATLLKLAAPGTRTNTI